MHDSSNHPLSAYPLPAHKLTKLILSQTENSKQEQNSDGHVSAVEKQTVTTTTTRTIKTLADKGASIDTLAFDLYYMFDVLDFKADLSPKLGK